jgi:hypothetical protein
VHYNRISNQHYSSSGWASRNANTVRSRTVSTAMYNMCCQAGSVIYSNIYRKGELSCFEKMSRAKQNQMMPRAIAAEIEI